MTVLSGMCELDEDNKKNWVKLNNTPDPTSNVTVQYTLSQKDKKVWDTMDEAIYQTIEALSGNQPKLIEYWDDKANKWVDKKPSWGSIRAPGVVHEASTAFVGRKFQGGSCDSLYRPHGIANVVSTSTPTRCRLQVLTNDAHLACYGRSAFPHDGKLESDHDNVRVCSGPCKEACRSFGLDSALFGL